MNENTVKETLYVSNGASKGLDILYVFFKVLIILKTLAGSFFAFLGIFGMFDNITIVVGVLIGIGIIISALIDLLFLQFLNSRIKMTLAAEYYIAKIEKEYTIK